MDVVIGLVLVSGAAIKFVVWLSVLRLWFLQESINHLRSFWFVLLYSTVVYLVYLLPALFKMPTASSVICMMTLLYGYK
jgi:hypothetical protein